MVAIDAERLRLRRQMVGDNQRQFAERAGISAGYINHLELGRRTHVSPRTFIKICDALGVVDRSELMLNRGTA